MNRQFTTLQKIIKFSTARFITGFILAVLVAVMVTIQLSSIKKGVVLGAPFLILGLVKLDYDFTDRKSLSKGVYTATLLIGFAALTVVLSQFIQNQSALHIGIINLLLSVLVVLCVESILLGITVNLKWSVSVSSIFLVLFGLINYYVYSFRGSELTPTDILSIGTAANVAEEYSFFLNGPMLYSLVLLLLSNFLLSGLPRCNYKRKIRLRLIFSLIGAMIVILFANIAPVKATHSYLQNGTIDIGCLLNFTLKIPKSIITKPAGYDKTVLERLERQVDVQNTEDKKQPDIIVIMNESFSDFRVFGEKFKTNEPVMPFIDSLKENTVKGYALSSVFGGGTPNSEFEFLTGNSMYFVPDGAIPYQQFIKKGSYSMVSYLESKGYETAAYHPHIASGWSRPTVYPNLGFDSASFLEDFPRDNLVRDFVSDQETYEYMLEDYFQKKEKSDDSQFLFGVTMQNHGAYDYPEKDYPASIKLAGYQNSYPDVEQYLSLINESDKAVQYLIERLSKAENDVVVVFFGDHFPNVNRSFFEESHGRGFETMEEKMLEFKVPFFVWTNFESQEKNVPLTSLNYLSNYMYEAGDMELPPYNVLLKEFEKEMPAINSQGYYDAKKKQFVSRTDNTASDVLRNYSYLEYNNLFDTEDRSKLFDFGSK